MGGDSCSEVCRFVSQHGILNEHFLTLIFVKFVMFVSKRPKKLERGHECPFLKKVSPAQFQILSLSEICDSFARTIFHFCRTELKVQAAGGANSLQVREDKNLKSRSRKKFNFRRLNFYFTIEMKKTL